MPLSPGEQIKEYIVGPLVGRGGLGEVYQAFNEKGERVAVKIMRDEFASDPQFQNRFIREIRLMQSVQHENIVPILDYGFFRKTLFMVMKFIEGPTLVRLMLQQQFSPTAVWHVLRDIAPAVNAGHEKNIIHRDLKPDNVLVEGHGKNLKFYLADFGLSKRPGLDTTLTERGTAVGTWEYMAPEMAFSTDPDPRSDIYSLGVMTYELLTGRLPFEDKNPYNLLKMHADDPPPPMTDHHPEFPISLQQVIFKALEKSCEDRYSDTIAFARAYYDALKDLPDEIRSKIYW